MVAFNRKKRNKLRLKFCTAKLVLYRHFSKLSFKSGGGGGNFYVLIKIDKKMSEIGE